MASRGLSGGRLKGMKAATFSPPALTFWYRPIDRFVIVGRSPRGDPVSGLGRKERRRTFRTTLGTESLLGLAASQEVVPSERAGNLPNGAALHRIRTRPRPTRCYSSAPALIQGSVR